MPFDIIPTLPIAHPLFALSCPGSAEERNQLSGIIFSEARRAKRAQRTGAWGAVRPHKESAMKKLILSAVAIAFLISPAMADSRSVNLQPGFTGAPDNMSPRANPGSVTGYAVPLGANGGQAGANWTSRSGNTHVGGYVGGNMGGGYQGGVSASSRF